MLLEHGLVGHVVGHFAQAVHVVREGEQARGQAGEVRERLAHPAGAGDFAERADMRQAGGAVAGFEQSVVLALLFQALGDALCFTEGPGKLCLRLGGGGVFAHDGVGLVPDLWGRNWGGPVLSERRALRGAPQGRFAPLRGGCAILDPRPAKRASEDGRGEEMVRFSRTRKCLLHAVIASVAKQSIFSAAFWSYLLKRTTHSFNYNILACISLDFCTTV